MARVPSTLERRYRLEHSITFLQRLSVQRRKLDPHRWNLRVRQAVEQVADQRQAAALLVVEVDQRPGRMLGVRGLEHRLAGAGVVGVGAARLEVDRRQLPALEGVFQALGEALFLPFLVGARSEEHTSELQSLMRFSYAVFC